MRERTGEELRQIRKKLGLSIKTASDLAQVNYRVWQTWEAKPESLNSHRPPGIVFSWLELYLTLKEHGLSLKEAYDERKKAA